MSDPRATLSRCHIILTGDEDNSQDAMAVTFGRIEESDGAKEELLHPPRLVEGGA